MSATRHKNFGTNQAQNKPPISKDMGEAYVFLQRGWSYRSCVPALRRTQDVQQLTGFVSNSLNSFECQFVGMCLKQPISGAPVHVLPSCEAVFEKKAVRWFVAGFFTQVATQTLGPLSTQEAKSINILFVSKGWVGGYALKIIFGCATSIRWWFVLLQWMGKIQQRSC